MRRVLAGALGLALLIGAAQLSRRETLGAPAWLAGWEQDHPDPRSLGAAGSRAHAAERGLARREDGVLLLLGLGAGCLACCLLPARRGSAGVVPCLAAGALALGLFSAGHSVAEQLGRARDGRWTLSDDALRATAGPFSATLRAWRARIPEDELVIVVGTQAWLFNVVSWVLFPRPIRFVGLPVPAGTSAAELAEQARALCRGSAGQACWLVDLEALAAADAASLAAGDVIDVATDGSSLAAERPALQRLLP